MSTRSVGPLKPFGTLTHLNHKMRAVLSGANTKGWFPWEQHNISAEQIRIDYGTHGADLLKEYRKASEEGVSALRAFRDTHAEDTGLFSRSALKDLPVDAADLNRQFEESSLNFNDIQAKYGQMGVRVLDDYRAKHFYEGASITAHTRPLANFPVPRPTAASIEPFASEERDNAVFYSRGKDLAFSDRGARIDVHQALDKQAVLAALQLASQKWDSFNINGTEQYKQMCVELAAEHGFKITNPELETALGKEKMRLALVEGDRVAANDAARAKEKEVENAIQKDSALQAKENTSLQRPLEIRDTSNGIALQHSFAEEFQRLSDNAEQGRPVVFFTDINSARAFMDSVYGERSGGNLVDNLTSGLKRDGDVKTAELIDAGEFQASRMPDGRNCYQLILKDGSHQNAAEMLHKAARQAEAKATELASPPRATLEREQRQARGGNDRGR
jgi:hypothetical protein